MIDGKNFKILKITISYNGGCRLWDDDTQRNAKNCSQKLGKLEELFQVDVITTVKAQCFEK